MRRSILIPAASATAALTIGILAAGGGFAVGRTTAPTPDACLVAIDEGERALGLSADALGLAGEAMVAAASWDFEEVDRISGEIDTVSADLGDGQTYRAAAAECRDGAR